MQVFKSFAAVVFVYMCVQGIIWLARGNTKSAIWILCLSPLLLLIWFVAKKISDKRDEKIDRDIALTQENPTKSSLFKDE